MSAWVWTGTLSCEVDNPSHRKEPTLPVETSWLKPFFGCENYLHATRTWTKRKPKPKQRCVTSHVENLKQVEVFRRLAPNEQPRIQSCARKVVMTWKDIWMSWHLQRHLWRSILPQPEVLEQKRRLKETLAVYQGCRKTRNSDMCSVRCSTSLMFILMIVNL